MSSNHEMLIHSPIAATLEIERRWHDSVALTEYLLYVHIEWAINESTW